MNIMTAKLRSERLTRLGILQESLGYVDGGDVYEYVRCSPVGLVDPHGTNVDNGTNVDSGVIWGPPGRGANQEGLETIWVTQGNEAGKTTVHTDDKTDITLTMYSPADFSLGQVTRPNGATTIGRGKAEPKKGVALVARWKECDKKDVELVQLIKIEVTSKNTQMNLKFPNFPFGPAQTGKWYVDQKKGAPKAGYGTGIPNENQFGPRIEQDKALLIFDAPDTPQHQTDDGTYKYTETFRTYVVYKGIPLGGLQWTSTWSYGKAFNIFNPPAIPTYSPGKEIGAPTGEEFNLITNYKP